MHIETNGLTDEVNSSEEVRKITNYILIPDKGEDVKIGFLSMVTRPNRNHWIECKIEISLHMQGYHSPLRLGITKTNCGI